MCNARRNPTCTMIARYRPLHFKHELGRKPKVSPRATREAIPKCNGQYVRNVNGQTVDKLRTVPILPTGEADGLADRSRNRKNIVVSCHSGPPATTPTHHNNRTTLPRSKLAPIHARRHSISRPPCTQTRDSQRYLVRAVSSVRAPLLDDANTSSHRPQHGRIFE